MRNRLPSWKTLAAVIAGLALLGLGVLAAANNYGKPKTVIHFITIKWKPEATPEQRQAAVYGVEKMAAQIPGIKNVWLKTKRVQGAGFESVIAIEFENEEAIKVYEKHPAHDEWYKVYIPVRGQSLTHQATN